MIRAARGQLKRRDRNASPHARSAAGARAKRSRGESSPAVAALKSSAADKSEDNRRVVQEAMKKVLPFTDVAALQDNDGPLRFSRFENVPASSIPNANLPSVPTGTFVPSILQLSEQQLMLKGHAVSAPGVEELTALAAARLTEKLFFYQPDQKAMEGPTSQGCWRLCSPLHTQNNMCQRVDMIGGNISSNDFVSRLPVLMKEDEAILDAFLKAVMKRLVETFGMDPAHEPLVRIHVFKWLLGSGLGMHGDSPTADDEFLFFMRLILRIGESQQINFKVYKFTEDDKMATEVVPGLEHTIVTDAIADAYLTSPFGNGKLPLCWADLEKKVGYQAKHEVVNIGTDGDEAVCFIIDFPLRTVEDVMKALEAMQKGLFSLDL